MTHGTDIRIAGNDPDGISYAFPFGGGGTGGVGKAQYTASEIQHGGFKAEPGPGAGFVKAGGQLFTFTGMGIFGHVAFDIPGCLKKPVQFLYGKVQGIH